jgi:hypothetical protein
MGTKGAEGDTRIILQGLLLCAPLRSNASRRIACLIAALVAPGRKVLSRD